VIVTIPIWTWVESNPLCRVTLVLDVRTDPDERGEWYVDNAEVRDWHDVGIRLSREAWRALLGFDISETDITRMPGEIREAVEFAIENARAA
jgi:hypothetical protein